MKKSKDWKAFMLYRYGYKQGIPSVKSARFWAVMIVMGTYLYKNMKYIKEFAQIMADKLKGKQMGRNLDTLMRNWRLFEFDALLEFVDYVGFHSGFNYGASVEGGQELQAARAKRLVELESPTALSPSGPMRESPTS